MKLLLAIATFFRVFCDAQQGRFEPITCQLDPGCGELLVAAAVKLLNELKP